MPVLRDGKIYLSGFVGGNFWDDGFEYTEIVAALATIGTHKDVDVFVNSPGGYTTEGAAIHALFSAHKGKVTMKIQGVAASAASLIAMAGDEIEMAIGSIMMIHEPTGFFVGYTEDQLDEAKEFMRVTAVSMAEIYAARSGNTVEAVRADMKATLWMVPSEAIEKGYATKAGNDNAVTVAAFDYRTFANAPERLVALASEKGWSLSAAIAAKAGSPVANLSTKGQPTMTDTSTAGNQTAATATADAAAAAVADAKTTGATEAKARIKSIMTSDEAKGRESLAEHFAYNTEMSTDDAIAAMKASPKTAEPAPAAGEGEGEGGTTADADDYANTRANAAGLAAPGDGKQKTKTTAKTVDASAIYDNRRKTVAAARS